MSGVPAQLAAGLAAGAVYALLALAVVLVHRASRVVNVAQAELATLSAFVCAALVAHGWAFWPAFGATIVLSFAGGSTLQLVLVRPLRGELVAVTALTGGLLLAVAGFDAWLWGTSGRSLTRPFRGGTFELAGVEIGRRELGTFALGSAALLLVALLLTRTKLGLGLRAAAANPAAARSAGVPVGAFTAAAWGLAAAVGAVAGVLAAALFGLEPAMLRSTLLYVLAAAAVGGLGSVTATVAAALALGVTVELTGRHVHVLHGGVPPVVGAAVLAVGLLARRP